MSNCKFKVEITCCQMVEGELLAAILAPGFFRFRGDNEGVNAIDGTNCGFEIQDEFAVFL